MKRRDNKFIFSESSTQFKSGDHVEYINEEGLIIHNVIANFY